MFMLIFFSTLNTVLVLPSSYHWKNVVNKYTHTHTHVSNNLKKLTINRLKSIFGWFEKELQNKILGNIKRSNRMLAGKMTDDADLETGNMDNYYMYKIGTDVWIIRDVKKVVFGVCEYFKPKTFMSVSTVCRNV